MVCTLFPLESISMYFISCAQKTRGEDKEVTQEPKHVVDSFPCLLYTSDAADETSTV